MIVVTERLMSVDADAVWDLLGERFADIGVWSDGVVASRLDGPLQEGAVRTCELKPTSAASGIVQERVTRFDRGARAVSYEIVGGLPGFMRHVENKWVITPIGVGRARVVSSLTIKLAWWMTPMAPMIRKQFSKLIVGLMDELEGKSGVGFQDISRMSPSKMGGQLSTT